jgi:arginase
MNLHIFQVSYDSGAKNARMGAGPGHFIRNGLPEALQARGCNPTVESIEASQPLGAEIATAFELARRLSERVHATIRQGSFPLVLFGNCNTALGTISGAGPADLGIIWFDAHGDFNTPETSTSGFLDGMGLATAAGLCWKPLAASIPGFEPVEAGRIVHVGGRDFDLAELALMERKGVDLVSAGSIRQAGLRLALYPALGRLRSQVKRVYVHIDLDVLDPAEAPANQFPVPGGLSVEQAVQALESIAARFTITACGVGAYAPEYDPENRALQAGIRLIETIAAACC